MSYIDKYGDLHGGGIKDHELMIFVLLEKPNAHLPA